MRILEWERRIVEALLTGPDPKLDALRQQYATAQVLSRDYTGVGYFTYFAVPETSQRLSPSNFEIMDVHLDLVGVESPAMAMLFVRQGVIDLLEVCTYYGAFPADPEIISIYYSSRLTGSQGTRDMDLVRSFWTK